jgi:hypothetical protein
VDCGEQVFLRINGYFIANGWQAMRTLFTALSLRHGAAGRRRRGGRFSM